MYTQNMGTVDCWGDVANGGDEELESILSILDFPMEGLEGDGFIGDWDAAKSADYLGPIPSDVMMNSSPLVLPPTLKSDATQLKQPSSYLPENTIRPFINKSAEAREPNGVFQMQSPISVLESNGPIIKSCTTKRNRSKRPKPPSLNPWLSLLPLSSGKARKRVRERRKPPQILGENSSDKGDNPLYSVTKRCAHCQVTKTPQWREGPMGPKTLCNACGVRYRSGRLFPEYRPAASPTFVAAIHSNSHRKVVEMRSKAVKVEEVALAMSPEMEFVPMSSYLFDDPV